jgi:formate hydrogenlyase subunit 4
MRMRAHDVQQTREHASPVMVIVLVAMVVSVLVIVVVTVVMILVRAVHAVHEIKHARTIALRHIDNYQGRAPAN